MSQLCTRYSNLAISISLLLTSALYAYATAIVQQSKTSIGNITIKEITTDENSAADQIYDKDISNSYIGKTQIERFKGTSPVISLKEQSVFSAVRPVMGERLILIFEEFKGKAVSPSPSMEQSKPLPLIEAIMARITVITSTQILFAV